MQQLSNCETKLVALVVDDDPLIHAAFKLILPKNWKLLSARSASELPSSFCHLAFVDMHLDKMASQGLLVLNELSKHWPQTERIAISGDLCRELMELSLHHGATGFLAKPLAAEEVLHLLQKIEAHWQLVNQSLSSKSTQAWIGESDFSVDLRRQIAKLKSESAPVLIQGETGVGKEVVACLLNSQEACRPFVRVNVAAISESLFESEFFGHVKGAFTGAETNKIGLLEAAHTGDLFLDEIEALSPSMQVKLLRFLETGEVKKVGSKDSFFVNTRVIAASNENLLQMVAQGRFRQDLLYRLSGHCVQLVPLRERAKDIPLLADFFLSQERPRRNKSFASDAIEALLNYDWPGNTRELKRVCEQASLTSVLPLIRAQDIERLLGPSKSDKNLIKHEIESNNLALELGLDTLLRKQEALILKLALKSWKSAEQAAAGLKISRSSFYKKLRDYNLHGVTE